MYNILILVADQSRARLYGTETVHAIPVEIEGFFTSACTYSPGKEHEARQQSLDTFAKNIAIELESLLQSSPRTSLYLMASPRVLEMLRDRMTPSVEKHIAGQLHKDLTNVAPAELPTYIKIINSVLA